MKVKILLDHENIYEKDSVIDAKDLIDSYSFCTNDQELIDFIDHQPIEKAVAFIAEAWSLDYELI